MYSIKSLYLIKTLLFTAKVWCRQAGYRRLNLVEAVSYTGSRYHGRGIGWSKSQRRKSEVLCGRSRSGRPYLLRQAPCPKAYHFPLALYPIAWEEGIQREKGKVVCGRSRSGRRIYPYRRPCQYRISGGIVRYDGGSLTFGVPACPPPTNLFPLDALGYAMGR